MYISVLGLLLGVALLVVGYGKQGQRRRRRGFIVAGWIVLGVQVLPITVGIVGCLGSLNWVKYKPTHSLLSAFESPGQAGSYEDYQELARRLATGKMNAEEQDRFAKVATSRYLATSGRGILPVDVKSLELLHRLGRLNPEQQTAFFERLVDVSIQAKPVALLDKGIPLRIEIIPRGDWSGCDLWCAASVLAGSSSGEEDRGRVAEERYKPQIRLGRSSHLYGRDLEVKLSPAPQGPLVVQGPSFILWQANTEVKIAGKQEVACRVKLEYFDRNPAGNPACKPVYTTVKPLTATSEVVTDASLVAARPITDPKLWPELPRPGSGVQFGSPRGWQISCSHFDLMSGPNAKYLKASVHISNAQVGCAFDVAVQMEDVTYNVGTICQPKDSTMTWTVTVPYPSSEPEKVTLTLTPNQELASESIDLTEIWGEVVSIRDIPRNRPVVLDARGIEQSAP